MLRPVVPLVSGLVIFVAGALVAFVRPVELGWTAYAPLIAGDPFPGVVVLDAAGVAGVVAALLGAALAAGALGYQLGHRHPDQRDTASGG